MGEIVDLTHLGPNLNLMKETARAALSNSEVTGFEMTRQQRELLPVLIQSTINRRSNVLRKSFMGVPIIEVTD